MKARVFQLQTAVAEYDGKTGEMTIRHGGLLHAGDLFAACDWIATLPRPDIEAARELIATHLNECPRFEWPLLPTIPKPTNPPRLTARDVLPGDGREDRPRLINFGVTTDTFEVANVP